MQKTVSYSILVAGDVTDYPPPRLATIEGIFASAAGVSNDAVKATVQAGSVVLMVDITLRGSDAAAQAESAKAEGKSGGLFSAFGKGANKS